MEQVSLNSIRKVLPDAAITEACRAVGHVFRKRKISPILTVLHLILAAIWPEDSFEASWQTLWDSFASRFPGQAGPGPSSGSVAKARGRLPLNLLMGLWAYLRNQVETRSESAACWRGHRVILMDGTCVSMPEKPDLVDTFGRGAGNQGPSKFPIARLVTLALANTLTVLAWRPGRYNDDENALLAPLLQTLRQGDLVLGDSHLAGARLYVGYQRAGLEFLTRARSALKIHRLKVVHRYAAGDRLVSMKVYPAYRYRDPTLPEQVLVRMIQGVVRDRGRRRVIWLVSSLLDAKRYPAEELLALYCRRWRMETLLKTLKLRLSADVLRSTTPEGISKELAARFLAVNIVRLIMLEAAEAYQVDPVRISFTHALRAILAFAPAMADAPIQTLPRLYQQMLYQIAEHQIPPRPGRHEPRMIRRKKEFYPNLKVTRKMWRKKNAS
jgi:hypothetical protein